MGYYPNISNLFYSYSLPSFLDSGMFDITTNNNNNIFADTVE